MVLTGHTQALAAGESTTLPTRLGLLAQPRVPPPPSEAGEEQARQRLLLGLGRRGRGRHRSYSGRSTLLLRLRSRGRTGSHSHQATAAQLPAAKGVPAAQRDLPVTRLIPSLFLGEEWSQRPSCPRILELW